MKRKDSTRIEVTEKDILDLVCAKFPDLRDKSLVIVETNKPPPPNVAGRLDWSVVYVWETGESNCFQLVRPETKLEPDTHNAHPMQKGKRKWPPRNPSNSKT